MRQPEAAGWLERRRVDATYRWTDRAELALDVNALTSSAADRVN